MNIFSLVGELSIKYADAVRGLDKVSDAADDAAKQVGELGDKSEETGEKQEGLGKKTKETDDTFSTWKLTLANLAANVIQNMISKIGELAGQIADLGMDTETSFAKLSTIADSSVMSMDEMERQIRELSTQTGQSAADIAEATYQAISAGVDTADAVEFVAQATNLAKGGFSDATTTVDALTTVMNAYGDAAGSAEHISDVLISTQNAGKTSVDELATNIGKVIPTANAYGVSLEDLSTAYVNTTANGVNTAESTTLINGMLNELGDSGSNVAAVLQEQTGKSFSDLMGEGYSLRDVLGIVQEGADADGTAFTDLWGSSEAMKAGLILLNSTSEDYNATLSDMQTTTGDTAEAAGAMADTTQTAKERMVTAWQDVGLSIYDGLQGPMSGAYDVLAKVASWASGHLPTIVALLGAVATAATTLFLVFKGGSIIQSVAGAFGALNAALAANPIAIVVLAVAALAAGFIALWNNCEGFRNFVLTLWANLQEIFGPVVTQAQEIFGAVSETISGFITSAGTFFTQLWTTVQTVWDAICNAIQAAVMLIGSILSAAFNIITLPWRFIWENIKEYIFAAWNAIQSAVSTAIHAVQGVIQTVMNAIRGFIVPIWTGIRTTISNVVNGIRTTVADVFGRIKTAIATPLNGAKSIVTNVFDGIKNKIDTVITRAKNIVSDGLDAIKGFFSKLNIKFPDIKLPHFSINGKFSLSPPSVPKLSIDWYAKAMDNAMLLNGPTIFGAAGGSLLGGGEAGQEVVSGSDTLMSMIAQAVAAQNEGLAAVLRQILAVLQQLGASLPDVMVEAIASGLRIVWNGREVARVVKTYA